MTICKDNARGYPLPPGVYEHREEDERPHGENCCLNQETTLRDPSSADTLRKGTSVVYGLTVKLNDTMGKVALFQMLSEQMHQNRLLA